MRMRIFARKNLILVFLMVVLLPLLVAPLMTAKGGKKPPPQPIDAAIAFVINNSGGIVVATEDGTQIFTVMEGRNATQPSFSPDGTRLAFLAQTGKTWKDVYTSIFTAKTDGTELTEVCRIVDQAYHYRIGVDWSPDGTKIAYNDAGEGGKEDIFIVNADGTGLPTNITRTPNRHEKEPSWSPEGDRLVVLKTYGGNALLVLELDENYQVLSETDITNVPGSPLAELGTELREGTWGKTSDLIVTEAFDDIWVIDLADPSNPTNATATFDRGRSSHPEFNDTDQKILYNDFIGSGSKERYAIWAVDSDGLTAPEVLVSERRKGFKFPTHRR